MTKHLIFSLHVEKYNGSTRIKLLATRQNSNRENKHIDHLLCAICYDVLPHLISNIPELGQIKCPLEMSKNTQVQMAAQQTAQV